MHFDQPTHRHCYIKIQELTINFNTGNNSKLCSCIYRKDIKIKFNFNKTKQKGSEENFVVHN